MLLFIHVVDNKLQRLFIFVLACYIRFLVLRRIVYRFKEYCPGYCKESGKQLYFIALRVGIILLSVENCGTNSSPNK